MRGLTAVVSILTTIQPFIAAAQAPDNDQVSPVAPHQIPRVEARIEVVIGLHRADLGYASAPLPLDGGVEQLLIALVVDGLDRRGPLSTRLAHHASVHGLDGFAQRCELAIRDGALTHEEAFFAIPHQLRVARPMAQSSLLLSSREPSASHALTGIRRGGPDRRKRAGGSEAAR